ncbi:hypothetical protein [Pseudactinotalea sp. Z1748]|uniref:hypothetical protein n=1 Tax=Pseudactinotalea sp. Z1748 TaxID=3413027 RepID=UPI003C7ACC14
MKVAMIPTARPTFAVDVAQQRADQARALLTELGAQVRGPRELVMTPEDIGAAAGHLEGADLVINVCASFSDANPALQLYADQQAPVLLWAFREPGPVGDRLWLNSLCGANLFGHALRRSGGQVRLLYGDPEEDQVRLALQAALTGDLPPAPALPSAAGERADTEEVRTALASLHGRSIGVIGDPPPGFTPSEYDPDLLTRVFGLRVQQLSIDEAFARVEAVGSEAQHEETRAAVAAQPSLDDLDPTEVSKHAAITVALREWSGTHDLASVAVRCWPEFPTRVGVCPCSSLSRLAGEGVPTQCERDVYGAATMVTLQALGAGMSYLVDTVDLDTGRNLVRFWHCGSAATTLAADPANAAQSVHCNRKIGVAGNFPLRAGPVIMARFTEDLAGDGLRLLIGSGQSLPGPNRFQGNTADVRLDTDASEFVHGLVTGGFPHHTVLAWTDVRPQLRAAADLLNIPVIEW